MQIKLGFTGVELNTNPYISGSMGCKKLNTDFFNFLEIVHSKKSAYGEKKRINYYPFGLKHKGYNNVVSSNGNSVAQRWKFGGKEYNEELGLDWYDFSARNYDPALGRWMNLDPLAEHPNQIQNTPYHYALNNPVLYDDPDGKCPPWICGAVAKAANMVSSFVGLQKTEQLFAIRHPIAATKIGSGSSGGISSTAFKISEEMASENNMTTGNGSEQNALRHGIWQAMVTQEFGEDMAFEAGMAHEGDRMPKVSVLDGEYNTGNSSGDADSFADILNNDIGKAIGKANPDATPEEIANLVLGVFKDKGMWTTKKTENGYIIERTKLEEKKDKEEEEQK